jgi:REP element-mobilizing transposase RayT
LFGYIEGGKSVLSTIGKFAENCLSKIPEHFPETEITSYVIMPNHVHAILSIFHEKIQPYGISSKEFICEPKESPTKSESKKRTLLSIIIGSYKSAVTKDINQLNPSANFKWQRYFYDHIIRNEYGMENVSNYIELNPARWEEDMENEDFLNGITETERRNRLEMFYKDLAGGAKTKTKKVTKDTLGIR